MNPAPNIFCWAIQFSAWPHLSQSACLFHQPSLPHLTAPRSGDPCCSGWGCLAAPLMPEPKLKQSLPLCSPTCAAAALQSTHSCVCSHRANRIRDGVSRCQGCTKEPHWAAGRAGHWQHGAAWTQSWLKQLKVALLGVQPQLTAALSPQSRKAFSPGAGPEGWGSSLNLSCEPCPLS